MKKGRVYTVHYGKNIETTKNFVDSIKPFLNSSLDLIILNNSNEINIENLKSEFISILNTEKNLGYFGAAKLGIQQFPISNLDYIIICNNDVQILNDDFFSLLEQKINNYDIIAPSIRTLENIEQNPHRENKIKFHRKLFYKLFFINYFFAIIFSNLIGFKKKKINKVAKEHQSERNIFSPHGAFIILNKSYFEKGGIIDDGYFLYGEEDSIAAIAKLNEMLIGFIPSLKILHQESITTGKRFTKQKYRFQKDAYKYILNKYPTIFNT